MKIGWFSLGFLVLSLGYGQSQPRVLSLDSVWGKESLTRWAYMFSLQPQAPIDSVLEAWRSGKFTRMQSANLGYHNRAFWFAIPISKQNIDREFFLEIANSHLDKISLFQLDTAGQFARIGNPTGDDLPFNTRSYNNRYFVWPLTAKEISGKTLLIRVEKLNSSLQVPLWMWERNTFREANTRTALLYGVGFGMMLLVVIYSLLAWLLIRDKVYGAYFFMIICSIFLLAINEGFAFQFLYPRWAGINSILRVSMSAVANGALILFSLLFLNIRRWLPRVARLLAWILAFYFVALVATPLTAKFLVRHSSVFLPIILTVILSGNVICFYAAIRTYAKQPVLSGLYIAAYSAILIATLATVLEDYGVWELPFNFLFAGALIETLVFSVALTYLMRKVYVERNELWLSISRYQKEAMQSYIKGIELERERVSRDLHDDIGSRLANLRRLAETRGLPPEQLLDQIQILAHDVRSLSHRLAPPTRSAKNLVSMVEALAQEIQQSTGIRVSVQSFDFPEQLNAELLNEFYRIVQEALQNIARHAQAKTADVQLFLHDDELVLTIEDDGRGFDLKSKPKGIGLENMQLRATNAGGIFEINSEPGRGTHILVSIPQKENDRLLNQTPQQEMPRD